jgi:hypothetical protein
MASGGPLTVGTGAPTTGGGVGSASVRHHLSILRGCFFALFDNQKAAEIEDERALVDSYGMLGKGIQEAIEIHNSRLGQMRRAVILISLELIIKSSFIIEQRIRGLFFVRCKPTRTRSSSNRTRSKTSNASCG